MCAGRHPRSPLLIVFLDPVILALVVRGLLAVFKVAFFVLLLVSIVFFLVFIVLTSFAILNLFIAVIVDSLQSKHFDEEEEREEKEAAEAHADRAILREELAGLRAEIAALRSEVAQGMRSASASKARDKDE